MNEQRALDQTGTDDSFAGWWIIIGTRPIWWLRVRVRMQMQFMLQQKISTTEKKKNHEPANVWGRDTGEDANLSIVIWTK